MAREILGWIAEKLMAFFRTIGGWLDTLWRHIKLMLSEVSRKWWQRIAIGIPVVFILYVLIGALFVTRIDDRYDLSLPQNSGGSKAVETVIALLERETETHNWTVNDPPFLPGWWVDNMPNYQRGMMGALSRFTIEMRDHLGRTRGSSAVDADLEGAAGNLTREMDRWIFDLSTSLFFTAPSDSYFREARRQLSAYNARLIGGEAVLDKRADNLMATLDRIALDLGASSAAIDDYISKNAGGFGFDTGSDDLFYQTKGQLYAYSYILMGLRQDFAKVMEDKDLNPLFDELMASLTAATSLDPFIVFNGSVDGNAANHLAMQGFYLLRARTQLREVTSILLT